MPPKTTLLRGSPRYLRDAAAGPYTILSLIPEATVEEDGTVRPTALIVLLPDSVQRHKLTGRTASGRQDLSHSNPPNPIREAVYEAEMLIVAGEAAPVEDPRIAAAFGPSEPIPGGVCIALFKVSTAGTGLKKRPSGEIRVLNGQILFSKS